MLWRGARSQIDYMAGFGTGQTDVHNRLGSGRPSAATVSINQNRPCSRSQQMMWTLTQIGSFGPIIRVRQPMFSAVAI